jgi:predicted enzyme related to lactoylglutathione lyase
VAANQGQIVQPKAEIPGVGWLAYCKDTEGNIFGVLEPTPM